MSDFNEIEQVLRRYEFRNLPEFAHKQYITQAAELILQRGGYDVRELLVVLDLETRRSRTEYFVEIDGRVIHSGIDAQRLIVFAHDLCNDYRDRDMAALVEYVKERQRVDMAILGSHGVAGAMAGEALRDKLIADQLADTANRSSDTIRDLADGFGYESAWSQMNEQYDLSNDWGDKKLRSDYAQRESTKMCDCSERLESLSERVERLERAGKSKDNECTISGPGRVYVGSGINSINEGDTISFGSTGINYHVGAFRDSTTFQVSDNVQWHASVGTGKVLIDRDDIVAEIKSRVERWLGHATLAEVDDQRQKAKRYESNAHVLQCLADDIESGSWYNHE